MEMIQLRCTKQMKEARERALNGEGATLIEAITTE